ncbi:MAG: MBL fold metallo-hydrolase [Acidobacteria bacterium]|nr:MBL fold metallo-hydrolase [Acidobacteriota bacterium]MBV9476545.1 MBL fold metallo-hydrolase [Acidobacteriota bacterium]
MKTLLLALLLAPALLAQNSVAQSGDVTSDYTTTKVADGIWAFIAPEPKSALASGNSVAIAGDDGVLVVDTGMIPSLAKRMIDEIRAKTGKPVRYIVNTHWHNDHNMGNFVYRDAFPGVTILSTPFTREAMADFDAKILTGYQQRGMAMAEKLRAQLDSRKNTDGTPMTSEQLDAQRALVSDVEKAMPQFLTARMELPNVTFTDALTIHLGRREIQVRFLGRANTAGDAIVYVPDAKVLVTGDLLVAPIPFATGSYLPEWIAALKKLDAMDATSIVPGHGAVEHDEEHLHALTRLLESVVAQVQAAVNAGLTLEETRKRMDIRTYADALTQGIASRKRHFAEYFEEPAVANLYKQLKGEPTNESPFAQ